MTPPDTEFARLRDLEDKLVAMLAFTLAGKHRGRASDQGQGPRRILQLCSRCLKGIIRGYHCGTLFAVEWPMARGLRAFGQFST
jgi:hypothetical protein